MFCDSCGAANNNGSKECFSCGNSLGLWPETVAASNDPNNRGNAAQMAGEDVSVRPSPKLKKDPMKSIGGILGICTTIFILSYWIMPNGIGNSAIEFALLTVIAAGVWTIAGLLYQRL